LDTALDKHDGYENKYKDGYEDRDSVEQRLIQLLDAASLRAFRHFRTDLSGGGCGVGLEPDETEEGSEAQDQWHASQYDSEHVEGRGARWHGHEAELNEEDVEEEQDDTEGQADQDPG